MKNKLAMILLYIFLAALFFGGWAFLQLWFLNRVGILKIDQDSKTLLEYSFPIIVPLLASIFIFIFSSIWFQVSPVKSIALIGNTFTFDLYLPSLCLGAAACLAISYLLYPVIIKDSFANAAFITVGITLFLLIVFFFIKIENGVIVKTPFVFKDKIVQIIGALIAILGLILMKIDDVKAAFK